MQTKFLVFILAASAYGSVVDIRITNGDLTPEAGEATLVGHCYWSGTSPFCAGGCPSNYQDCRTDTCGDGACCWTGYKKYCCQGGCPTIIPAEEKPLELNSGLEPLGLVDVIPAPSVLDVDIGIASCFWSGTSPFCAGSCPAGYNECLTDSCGDGACCWTGYKKYCCTGVCSGSKDLPAIMQRPERLEKPSNKLLVADGDYDDICGKDKFICCPLNAHRNEECICLNKKSGSASMLRSSHRVITQRLLDGGNGDFDDLCKDGERLCCPPGATENKQCRCASEDKYLSLDL